MKAKGTNVWEQYIEYVVLIVAIVILGWFAWVAFGTKIEHRQGKIVVHAGTIDDELIKAAVSLEYKIKDGTPSPLSITAPEALHDKFSRQLSQSISPKDRVVFPHIDLTAELDSNQNVQSELREYVSPVVPEPLNMRSRQWYGTIAESAISETDGLVDSIEGPPHDTVWVQVAGTVDINSIIESYAATADYSAIPQQWYDEAIDIFDVEIQRQTMVSDGWSDPETISSLPGQLTYRTRLADGSIDAIERDEIVRELRTGKQDDIVNPSFFRLKGFIPNALGMPGMWAGDVEIEESPLQLLQGALEKVEEKIRQKEIEIANVKEDIRDAGGGGGIGGGGRGDGAGDSSGSNDRKIERLKRKLEREESMLVELVVDKEAIELEIEELKDSIALEEGESVLAGEVWVWGHDMSVEPGETYRYRMNVQLVNPFFGHKPSLFSHQHILADSVAMSSQQSDWTESIKVQETKQWFVKNAKAIDVLRSNDIGDLGYISIDVFEFSDGQWTKKSRDVRVGQPISVEGIDEGLGWFVLDVVEDVQGRVVLLQSTEPTETGEPEYDIRRPNLELATPQYRQLQQQIKEQSSSSPSEDEDDDDTSDSPNEPPGGGPMGGPGGGGGRG